MAFPTCPTAPSTVRSRIEHRPWVPDLRAQSTALASTCRSTTRTTWCRRLSLRFTWPTTTTTWPTPTWICSPIQKVRATCFSTRHLRIIFSQVKKVALHHPVCFSFEILIGWTKASWFFLNNFFTTVASTSNGFVSLLSKLNYFSFPIFLLHFGT